MVRCPKLVAGVALASVMSVSCPAQAAERDDTKVPIPLTALDLPFNARGFPSMRQSQDLTFAAGRLATFGIGKGFDRVAYRDPDLATGLGIATAYLVAGPMYFGTVWMHEEWHRAVMSNRNISSRNGLFDPDAWSGGLIAVDRVRDEDLARLKARHPADTARLMMAGVESQSLLTQRMSDDAFANGDRGRWYGPLYASRAWTFPIMQVSLMSNVIYHANCSGPSSDRVTDESNQTRLTVESRDFTGLDCTAFAYDLHRPDEPYEARGAHPYGEGVDRYRSWEDLSARERRFVRRQLGLSALDLLNPHLYGIDGFRLGHSETDRWNVMIGHGLTPFGYTINARAQIKWRWLLGYFALRNGVNARGWFPSISATLADLRLWTAPVSLDLRADLWLQPEAQRYDSPRPQPGALLAPALHWLLGEHASLDLGLTAKSAGYVPGNVFLDPNLSLHLGATARL